MSDNPTVANSPTSSLTDIPVRGDADAAGKIRQVMRLDVATGTSETLVSSSNPMPVAIISGGGSGGTASNFGAAFPATGTAIGAKDSAGTNMAALNLNASGALKVDGSAVTQPVSGTFWQATQPVSAASLPLPTGAATSAKQPALGTAGSASADVITVQGIASMTALKVDGSGVTQPVSGTVTANIGTSGSLALDATLTGGTQQSKITDGTNVATVKAASTAAAATDKALVVAVSPNNSVAVTGTVTANAGTNLNTSLLALESGGNLATLAGAVASAKVQSNTAQINGVAPSMGNGVSGTGVQRVTIASDSTGQVAIASGTVTTVSTVTNLAQMNGAAITMGNGVSGTGVQRVTLASDSTGQVALAAGSATIGALTANQSVNVNQIGGVAVATGNGVVGTGVQRVAIASDNTAIPVNPSQTTATPQTLVDLASASIISTYTAVGTFTASTRIAALVNTTSVILVFSLNGGTNSHFRVFPMSKQVIDFGANGLKTAASVSVKYDTVSPGSGNGVASIEGLS